MHNISLAVLFVITSTNAAFAWRCTDPDHPKCPHNLCVHDPSMPSDYCANGLVIEQTDNGFVIKGQTPEAAEKLRDLSNSPLN